MPPSFLTNELITEFQRGSITAMDKVYDYYAPLLYGAIIQAVPEAIAPAILRQAFIEIYKQVKDYNGQKESLFSWMYRLTMQKCTTARSGFFGDAIVAAPAERHDPIVVVTFQHLKKGLDLRL